MSLDPSIILGAKTLDVNALYDQAQQARAQEQATQLNAMKLQEASQAMEERNKMRALFARPGFSMESPEAVQQMYQVSPEMGMKFQAEQADRQYKLNQAKKLDLELKGQQYNKSIGEIVNYTNAQDALAALDRNAANLDPNKYQSLKAELAAIGNDPAQFKSWRNKTLMGILDAKDQIHAQQQEITLAETGRHNRATEATARGQLGVSQGNLALARQKEAREAAGVGGTGKPLTEAQGKATGLAMRAKEAHNLINTIGAGGTVKPGIIKGAVEQVPFIGNALGSAVNVIPGIKPSAQQQQVEQAQRDFVNAVLRQESGAAISQSEFDNAQKQYFPQPGDSAAVIKQKSRNRETAIRGLEIASGPTGQRIAAPAQGQVVDYNNLK